MSEQDAVINITPEMAANGIHIHINIGTSDSDGGTGGGDGGGDPAPNPDFDVSTLSPVAWINPNVGIGDQINANHNLMVRGGATTPGSDTLGGKGVMSFTAHNQQYQQIDSIASAGQQPWSFAAVIDFENGGGALPTPISFGVNGPQVYIQDGALKYAAENAEVFELAASAPTEPFILVVTNDGTNTKAFMMDGTSQTGAAGYGELEQMRLGGYDNASASRQFVGKVGDVALWNGALSVSQINTLGNGLAAKYGLTWTDAA